jgi:hypothetical protein
MRAKKEKKERSGESDTMTRKKTENMNEKKRAERQSAA